MTDKTLLNLIKQEEKRQKETLQLIPSENYVSKQVRLAEGSVLMNKYSEGYAGRRYYQGNSYIDEIEKCTIDRAKRLFNVVHVNVQAYSGSPANSAVQFALLEPNDVVMGLGLAAGGHLTHGHPQVTFSGKYFKSIQYGVKENGEIDYEEVEKLAIKHKPKLIVSGATAYTKKIDFERFGKIADKVGAWHMADISHIAGLIAGGVHPSPIEYAHVVTTTTHKTLRGPRGAMIMVTQKGIEKDAELGTRIDKAVFPGLQGGPHNNTTAAIGMALYEAEQKEFKEYAEDIVKNANTLAIELKKYGFKLIGDGTENHLILIDLNNKSIDGWCAAWALEYAGIIVNRNAIPFDKNSPFYPSGIRLGTPAVTTRGMKTKEMVKIAEWVNRVINQADVVLKEARTLLLDKVENTEKANEITKEQRKLFKELIQTNKEIKSIQKEVKDLCTTFPLNLWENI